MTFTEPFVALYLSHETADPAEVTAATGITPTRSGRVGDIMYSFDANLTYPYSDWMLQSRLKGELEVTAYLYDLFDQLKPHWPAVIAISKKWAAGMVCHVSCDGYDKAIHLNPDMMSRIAALDADLVIRIYTPSD